MWFSLPVPTYGALEEGGGGELMDVGVVPSAPRGTGRELMDVGVVPSAPRGTGRELMDVGMVPSAPRGTGRELMDVGVVPSAHLGILGRKTNGCGCGSLCPPKEALYHCSFIEMQKAFCYENRHAIKINIG